jgi:hypothetical protein
MASRTFGDNEPFIISSIFLEVQQEVEIKYGRICTRRAESVLFAVMNDSSGATFWVKLSKAISRYHVAESERTKYHSFGTKYFKRVKKHFQSQETDRKYAQTSPTSETNWASSSRLCEQEQYEMKVSAGEDRLDPGWEPEYVGPTAWHT